MLCTVFRKADISWWFLHCIGLNLISNFNSLWCISVLTGTWLLITFESQQASIVSWNREFTGSFCSWHIYEFLTPTWWFRIPRQICAWALTCSTEVMLFLSFITCSIIFIIIMEESILGFRILFNADIRYWILIVIIVNRSWNLFKLFWVREIAFLSITNSNFLETVLFRLKSF